MNRVITQIGQSIYEWFFTKPAQDGMVALSKLTAAVLGTSPAANGLACTPTSPASLQVSIGAGEIYALAALEATAYGTLPADTTHQIVKQGVSLDPTLVPCAPAPTAGQSINYLIQVQYQDQDVSIDPTTGATAPVVLQFYNASNPTQPWQGPNNSGQTSNTFRKGIVGIQAKAGIAAPTGTQVTPAPDAGWTGLWVVTVANGQTTITAGNISQFSGAPFLTETLQQKLSQTSADARYLQPSQVSGVVGQSRNARLTTSTTTATLTADEVIVETAPGGLRYCLSNLNLTLNLATTGAGGMDTGTATANGWLAVYVIFNPATGARNVIGQMEGTSAATSTYTGANMPPGYTASCLRGVLPIGATAGQIAAGAVVIDDEVFTVSVLAINTSVVNPTITPYSISTSVPKAAKIAIGNCVLTSTSASQTSMNLSSNGVGQQNVGYGNSTYGTSAFRVPITSPQTISLSTSNTAGTPSYAIYVSGFKF